MQCKPYLLQNRENRKEDEQPCRSIAFICVLFITGLAGLHIHAENTPLPDSILTRKYISQISVTEPERALALIDEMEQRKLQSQFRLDHLRSVVYQNGMSMFRLALKYSMKAYRNDSYVGIPMKPSPFCPATKS